MTSTLAQIRTQAVEIKAQIATLEAQLAALTQQAADACPVRPGSTGVTFGKELFQVRTIAPHFHPDCISFELSGPRLTKSGAPHATAKGRQFVRVESLI